MAAIYMPRRAMYAAALLSFACAVCVIWILYYLNHMECATLSFYLRVQTEQQTYAASLRDMTS